MSRESDGLIQRVAALLRQQKVPHRDDETDAGSGYPGQNEPPIVGGSVNQDQRYADPILSIHATRFDTNVRPMSSHDIIGNEDARPIRILRAILLHKFVVIGCILGVFAVSSLVILSITPLYTAQAVIAVGNQEPSVSQVESKAGDGIGELQPDPATVKTQADVLRSRPLVAKAMDELKLWLQPEFSPQESGVFQTVGIWVRTMVAHARELLGSSGSGISAEPKNPAAAGGEEDNVKRNQAVDIFLSKLTVVAKEDSRIISVQFEDREPRLAAAAANALVDRYIAHQIEAKTRTAQRTTAGLEQTVATLRQRVAQSDQAYEQFRASFEPYGGREFLDRRTTEASTQLLTAEIARKELDTRLASLWDLRSRNATDDATSEVAQSPVMQNLRKQATEFEGKLAELSATLGSGNPKTQELRAAIARTHQEMRSEIARLTAAVESDFRVAATKEASLRQSLAAHRNEAAQSSGAQAKLDALKAEADTNRAVLNQSLTQLHEAETSAKLLLRANAEIVSYASVPLNPTKPNLKFLLAIAAVGSALAGLGIALALERTDPTFRSGEQIETEMRVRTLALVPLTRNPKGPHDEAIASPASFYGEAIRALYMTLLLRRRCKMIVVSSARPGEGKTTLATSLALVAAKAGRKVLLVDGDLCTGGASRAFGVTGHDGFAELIIGDKSFSDVVATAGPTPNFHFLAAGTRRNSMAARSTLESSLRLFRRLREDYDLVVINSPPVLAVPDAMALSANADAILFAVRWGTTPRAAAQLGLRRLLDTCDRNTIAGVVLTMVDPRTHTLYGYANSAFYAKELTNYHSSI